MSRTRVKPEKFFDAIFFRNRDAIPNAIFTHLSGVDLARCAQVQDCSTWYKMGSAERWGLAAGTTILQRRLTLHTSLLDQQQSSSSGGWSDAITPVREWVQQSGSIGAVAETQVATIVQHYLNLQATVAAYQDCFMVLMVAGLASTVLLLLLVKPRTA